MLEKSNSSTFREDIQIYRGVAILAVLLSHTNFDVFRAGFLGVDIFFVVSGYILTHIHKEPFNIKHFYFKRINRLAPMYFTIIIITAILFFFFAKPSDFDQLKAQILYSIAFIPNFYYWIISDYFGKSDFNVLLHLWSFGVEIQFYILFPILISIRNKNFLWILAVSSIFLCLITTTYSTKTSFFMMPLRIWQFIFGMLAANLNTRSFANGNGGTLAFTAVILMLFFPVNTTTNEIMFGHVGFPAILISALTALGLNQGLKFSITKKAPLKILKYIGDRSYSIYLIHFPVFIFIKYQPFEGISGRFNSLSELIISLSFIWVMSEISYKFIEKKSRALFSKKLWLLVTLSLGFLSVAMSSIKWDRATPAERLLSLATTNRPPLRCGKFFEYLYPNTYLCSFGKVKNPARKIMLIGDSHADALKPTFIRLIGDKSIRLDFAAPNHVMLEETTSPEWLAEEARKRQIDTVFIHYSPRNLTLPFLMRIEIAFANHPTKLVFLEPIPIYQRSVPAILFDEIHRGVKPTSYQLTNYESKYATILHFLRSSNNIKAVRTATLFCTPNCKLANGQGYPFYADDSHLTSIGAKQLEATVNSLLFGEIPAK